MSISNLMSKARRLSLRVSVVLLSLTLVASVPVFVVVIQAERAQVERTLLLAATRIEAALCQAPEALDVLQTASIGDANSLLQPIVDMVAAEYPDMGMGIYSRRLDAVVSIHPFSKDSLRSFSRDYPYFKSYLTGELEFGSLASSSGWIRDAVLSVTVPVHAGREIVGYAWTHVTAHLLHISIAKTLGVMLIGWAVAYLLTRRQIWKTFAAIRRDIAQFAQAMDQGEEQIESEVLAELSPLLQTLQHQKQAMAAEIRAKEEARRELEKLFSISRDYVCISRDTCFLKVNPAFYKALGYTEQEMLGKSYLTFLHPDYHADTVRTRKLLHNGEPVSVENRYICADGSTRTISWVAVGDEGIIYAFGRDITEQRKMEMQLAKLDKLNLAGEMAASISHEIRNPLTTVRGFIQLAQIRGEALLDEHYQTMIEELDRANSIITEYLSLSKDKTYTRTKGSLNKLLLTLEPLIEAEAAMKGHQVVVELMDLPALFIDENEIRQLVLNLVKNGLEAMRSQGTLTIRTSLHADAALLEVSDQGPGIPDGVLQRIGTPFFTTKENGSGLGLAVCYRIAERHDAKIRVATGDTGTTFSVLFPL